MGAAGSVMDPAALRREYEAKSAENVGDEKLLAHMKKIIISAPSASPAVDHKAAPKTKIGKGTVTRPSMSRRTSHDAGGSASTSKTDLHSRRASSVRRYSSCVPSDCDRPLSAPTNIPGPKWRPRSSEGGKTGNKSSKTRKRSYLNNVVPQTGGGQNSDEMKSEPALALLATPGVTGEPEADIKVDSWESVSQQPSCPVCHMVFSSESKRDQHIKFSPVHTKNVPDPNSELAEASKVVDETSSRTIYSGTKFFWRTGLNVELFMQQHEQENAIQVLAFDTTTNREIGQIWVSMEKVAARVDKKILQQEVTAVNKNFEDLKLETKPEDVLAEATRKATVSFLVNRLQVKETTNGTVESGEGKSYEVTVHQMASDAVGKATPWNLVVEQPAGVNPAFSRAAPKRASTQQMAEVLVRFRQSISAVQETAQVAAKRLEGAEEVVQAAEQARRGSIEVECRASTSTVAPAKVTA